jgi:hypothetical protein
LRVALVAFISAFTLMLSGVKGMCGDANQGGGSSVGAESGPAPRTKQKSNDGGAIPLGVPVSPEEFQRKKEEAAKPKSPPGERPQKDE